VTISEERYWLTDAELKKGRIRLQFAVESTGRLYEFSDPTYKPYFYVPSTYKGVRVGKINLFTGEKVELTRIPGSDVAGFSQTWEDELAPEVSYVYDRGLHYSLPHRRIGDQFELDIEEPKGSLERFEENFPEYGKNPLKAEILAKFFRIANQPVPQFLFELPFFGEKASADKIRTSILLSRIANIPLPEAFRSRGVSSWIKSILDDYYRSNNILIPSSEELRKGDQRSSVQGALTIAPMSGTYFGMVVLDFESLYPGCMDVFNLSYETINCEHETCRENKVPGLNVHVCRQRRGVYSAIIGALRELRVHWYKPISRDQSATPEEREQAKAAAKILKLILVSCYGVTVRIHGLASPLLAESITAYGRHVLSSTWKIAEESGLKPRYGDTDSIFLSNPSQSEIEDFIQTVKERFNLELAVEKSFSLCVLSSAMKAYFGILRDGTPDIKGLSVIKSNSPHLFQQVFDLCVKQLANVRDLEAFEQAKKQIAEIYEHTVSELRTRNFDLKDLIYNVEIHEVPEEKFSAKVLPQPYQAARILRDSGVSLKEWDEIRFIKVKPFRHAGRNFTVKPAEMVSPIEVNVEDYVRTLSLAMGQVFEPMGISFGKSSADRTLADFV
jgi:DNA polymerase, archaea type